MSRQPRIDTIDLDFLGIPESIAVYALPGPEGTVLVESGPMSTVHALSASLASIGVAPSDVTDVLVTHVHLDHAGSAGWWAAHGARIHVHRRGHRHLADPSRLMASASRVYGSAMNRLWGTMPPVPLERLIAHDDGDMVAAGGLVLRCIDTPGHANHHLCFVIDGAVFTGDVAGIRMPGQRAAMAPTPPPDIDIAAWMHSLDRLRQQQAERLFLTHFGEVRDPSEHLDRVAAALMAAADCVAQGLGNGLGRDGLSAAFDAWYRSELARQGVTGRAVDAYLAGNPPPMAVDGLQRYLGRSEAVASERTSAATATDGQD
jgi:glyoxylase-like metal-dependent hydrolase (beta-lactamase superfamily II)